LTTTLSSGTIQLALAEKAGGGTKAFNLTAVIQDVETTKNLSLPFLSGSQKFRVAVSLARGIGKYASTTNKPTESVIIDEGFGSLDKEGRQDMINTLQDLKSVL
jgi:DNA repair protein SbcC/Rad50